MTNQKIDKASNPIASTRLPWNGLGYPYAPPYSSTWNISNLKAVTKALRPDISEVLLKLRAKEHCEPAYMSIMRRGYVVNPALYTRSAFCVANQNRVTTPPNTAVARARRFGAVDMYRYTWNVLNIGLVTGVTAVAILVVQSPIKTVLLTHIKSGRFMPVYTGGKLGLVQSLYVGTTAAFSGLVAKSLYVINVKAYKPRPDEEQVVKAGYIVAAGAGYTLVNNGPCNFSDLQKALIISQDFNWRTVGNARRLVTGGFSIKYIVAMLNMGALCGLEFYIADVLPIQNQKVRFASAGALSGAAAALVTYPFSVLKDYSVLQTTVIDGQLKNKSTYDVTRAVMKRFTSNPSEAAHIFMMTAMKQMPVRLVNSSLLFAIISGVGNALGIEPLSKVIPERYQPLSAMDRHRFFSQTPLGAQIEAMSGLKNKHP